MQSEDAQVAEEVVEKEINLSVQTPASLSPDQETNKDNTEANILKPTKTKSEPKIIPKKDVVELTDEDKATIIANYQNGVNQPFYTVKQYKNGKYRILKKKESQPTVAQKVVNNTPVEKAEKKVYYSDNQLLFEHIIELNAKVDRLMTKHKKLKKKYQALQSDIYVDEDSENVESGLEQNEPKIEQKQSETKPDTAAVRAIPQHVQRGWRSQITFL